MRLASDDDLAAAVQQLVEGESRLARYRSDMLEHPTAGRCLRNYIVLTDFPELIGGSHLSEEELFWSRYYWLARLTREWQAAVGSDVGLEQQLFQFLEYADVDYDCLEEVEAAVERDAVKGRPTLRGPA
jgi:hypothetical protein